MSVMAIINKVLGEGKIITVKKYFAIVDAGATFGHVHVGLASTLPYFPQCENMRDYYQIEDEVVFSAQRQHGNYDYTLSASTIMPKSELIDAEGIIVEKSDKYCYVFSEKHGRIFVPFSAKNYAKYRTWKGDNAEVEMKIKLKIMPQPEFRECKYVAYAVHVHDLGEPPCTVSSPPANQSNNNREIFNGMSTAFPPPVWGIQPASNFNILTEVVQRPLSVNRLLARDGGGGVGNSNTNKESTDCSSPGDSDSASKGGVGSEDGRDSPLSLSQPSFSDPIEWKLDLKSTSDFTMESKSSQSDTPSELDASNGDGGGGTDVPPQLPSLEALPALEAQLKSVSLISERPESSNNGSANSIWGSFDYPHQLSLTPSTWAALDNVLEASGAMSGGDQKENKGHSTSSSTENMKDWTARDVAKWVCALIGSNKYEGVIVEEEINGLALEHMTYNILISAPLNLKVGHAVILEAKIKASITQQGRR